jgi:amino acid transporter
MSENTPTSAVSELPPGDDTNGQSSPDGLRRNVLGFPQVLMQAVAQIAPAAAFVGAIAFNTQLAGLGAPSTFLVAFVLAFMVAITIGQLGKFMPSAGGLGTYVSACLGPSTGFITGWLYSWTMAAAGGAGAAFFGGLLQDSMRSEYDINVPWQASMIAIIVVTALVSYRGIRTSGRALMVLSIIELIILIALSTTGILFPGPGGITVENLNPANSTSLSGFYLAVIFSVFTYTGWEGAAAIAEESRRPRWAVPRAMALSVVIIGVFLVFCAWGIQIGVGVDNISLFSDSTENPVLVLGQRLWGVGWLFVLFAILNSEIAVAVATSNDSTRMWYSLARAKTLPPFLNHVHPTHKTPSRAITLQIAFTTIVGLLGGTLVGPIEIQFFFGVAATIIIVLVYILANISVFVVFRTRFREHRNWLMHIVLPSASTVLLLWVAWKSLYPLPTGANKWAPLAAGIILLGGLGVLITLRLRSQTDWRRLIQRVYDDRAGTVVDAQQVSDPKQR